MRVSLASSFARPTFLTSVIIATLAACGGDDGTPADTTDASVDAQVGSFSVKWGPKLIPAMTESTECIQVRLGNAAAIKVHEIHNVLGLASHHFILYRTANTDEYTTPRPCQPFTGTLHPDQGAPLMITQRSDETLTLPDDVAFTLAPNQMMRLELHYLNATDAPQMVEVNSELRTLASASKEADFLFIGTPDINLPSHTPAIEQTIGPMFVTMPVDFQGVNVFALTGHTHKLGTEVLVATAHNRTDLGTSVYAPSPFSWTEPETVYHRPPFVSTEGYRFSCKFKNDTGMTVKFGENTTDEMCFFWAYYYPSHGPKVCVHSNQAGGANGVDLCCPGNALCGALGL